MKQPQGTLSISRFDMHKRNKERKEEQLSLTKDLYASWLPYKDENDPYMVHLRRRIKVTENQLKNMKP